MKKLTFLGSVLLFSLSGLSFAECEPPDDPIVEPVEEAGDVK